MTTSTRILPLTLALALAAAAATAPAQTRKEMADRAVQSWGGPTLACGLLTNDEVARISGRRTSGAPDGVQLANGGSHCMFGSDVTLIVFTGPRSSERYDGAVKAFKHDNSVREAVPGVGDSAYLWRMVGTRYQGTHRNLVVRRGEHTVAVSIQERAPEPAEALRPKLEALAKATLQRLPA